MAAPRLRIEAEVADEWQVLGNGLGQNIGSRRVRLRWEGIFSR